MTYSGAGSGANCDRPIEVNDPLIGLSFDDVLGPGSLRYLAEGYARVDRGFSDGYLDIDTGRLSASATGFAVYPADWSVKAATRAQSPHLSSIDGIVLAQRLVESSLSELSALAGVASGCSWTYEVDLRAGVGPHQDVGRIPMHCEITGSPERGDVLARCRIGPIRVRLGIRLADNHPLFEAIRSKPRRIPLADEPALHLPETTWSTRLEPMSLSSSTLGARHAGKSVPGLSTADGVRRLDPGSVSFVDLLRLSAQQAQALIYARDGATRQTAESFWMRKARFTATSPIRALPTSFDMQLAVVKEARLARGGRPWRLFDVVAHGVPSMHASASLAYEGD